MPDLHSPSDLDRAFEVLTSELSVRSVRPGAAAAMATARRRRRTTVAAVAAAAVLAVGAVVLPLVAPERIGLVADLPPAAPFDVAAVERATDGWVDGWVADEPVGSFGQPACDTTPDSAPRETSLGRSAFASSHRSGMTLFLRGYDRPLSAEIAYDEWTDTLTGCRATTGARVGDYPDGTAVQHYRTTLVGSESDPVLTDIWVARSGDRLGVVEAVTDGAPATGDAVEGVADALVAGLRSGWTEIPMEVPEPAPPASTQMPGFDVGTLRIALAGWQPAERMDAFDSPTTPCMEPVRGGISSSEATDPDSFAVSLTGFTRGGRAATEAADVLDMLRGCADVRTSQRALPTGVTVTTYRHDGDGGHGAVWVAHTGDRVLVVEVDGVATPLPDGTAATVGAWLRDVLDKPWSGSGGD